MLIVDIEASGLHPDHSYPIEIAVVDSRNPTHHISFMIQPAPHWDYWDPIAEEIHGISRDTLLHEGVTPAEACEALNQFAAEQILISDAPDFDFMWLRQLFSAAQCRMRFRVGGFHQLLDEQEQEWLHHQVDAQLRPHRALADAQLIATTYEACLRRRRR